MAVEVTANADTGSATPKEPAWRARWLIIACRAWPVLTLGSDMHHELQTLADPDPDAVARAGAAFVGGHTPWAMFAELASEPLARLLADDTTIPAGRVEAAASLVMADRAAT